MSETANLSGGRAPAREEWVDYAKGLCIIMVVMLWVTYEYGHAVGEEGWLHHLVTFSRPFRMPDFFLLAGLFLSLSINAPGREYFDRKVLHFIYFYLLWLIIQLPMTELSLLLSEPAAFAGLFAVSLLDPVNTLWFVHMLAIFFVVTRLVRNINPLLVFAAAALLQTAYHFGVIATEYNVINRFFDRYVYFFTGYAAAPWIFAFARRVVKHTNPALAGLLVWALVNGILTWMGVDQTPGTSLALGFAGAAAVVAIGALLAERSWARWLAYVGSFSIVVYLTAFFPMKVMIKLLLATAAIPDVGTATAIITLVAVSTPLIFHRFIRNTWLNFLYVRPDAFKLSGKRRAEKSSPILPEAREST